MHDLLVEQVVLWVQWLGRDQSECSTKCLVLGMFTQGGLLKVFKEMPEEADAVTTLNVSFEGCCEGMQLDQGLHLTRNEEWVQMLIGLVGVTQILRMLIIIQTSEGEVGWWPHVILLPLVTPVGILVL